MEQQDGFIQFGGDRPASPVIVSVPHAGRLYPSALLAALAQPADALVALEDRHVDAVALAARHSETMLVQQRARAWIDLNRSERERDARVESGAVTGQAHVSSRVRGGLGLVPRRGAGQQPLWRTRFAGADIDARIAADHRPYHVRLEALLDAARARFGVAVLLDLHSMPPLRDAAAQVVIGDRYGRTAAGRFVARVAAAVAGHSIVHALNQPYAGGHIAERHGRPARGIHAIQLELDRALYLDAGLDGIGPGLARTAAMVRAVIDALAAEAGAADGVHALPLAAE